MGAGAVAPAWPADKRRIGIPDLIHSSITKQLSVANFRGGTTKQFEFDINGFSNQEFLPPDNMCTISIIGFTYEASVNETPTCLLVPAQQAKTVFKSISKLSVISLQIIGLCRKWMLSRWSDNLAAANKSETVLSL